MLNRLLFVLAGVVGAAAVGLGAFSAHGLEKRLLSMGLEPDQVAQKLETCDIAVRYHLIHAVALLGLAVAPLGFAMRRRALAAVMFVVGLLLFCGVLYLQAIAGLKGFNLIVPLGGLSFIIGWLVVASCGFGRDVPSAGRAQ